jgi:hypothetical protein
MMFFVLILIASAFLFFKERSVGTFVIATYAVSTLSGLIASVIEPATVLFVTTVFGHVFLKRHPDLYHETRSLVRKGRKKIRASSKRTDGYIEEVYRRVAAFVGLGATQAALQATRNYIDVLFSSLKIRDVADAVYGLLYSDDDKETEQRTVRKRRRLRDETSDE